MKTNLKKRFIEEIKKSPVIEVVCQRLNISRQTFYVWISKDTNFKQQVELAKQEGIDLANDIGETNTLNDMKAGDKTATMFWLRHNHPRYRKNNTINNNIYPHKQ